MTKNVFLDPPVIIKSVVLVKNPQRIRWYFVIEKKKEKKSKGRGLEV
jgi:hypothetical protein